jgi:hypothetical protein
MSDLPFWIPVTQTAWIPIGSVITEEDSEIEGLYIPNLNENPELIEEFYQRFLAIDEERKMSKNFSGRKSHYKRVQPMHEILIIYKEAQTDISEIIPIWMTGEDFPAPITKAPMLRDYSFELLLKVFKSPVLGIIWRKWAYKYYYPHGSKTALPLPRELNKGE